MSDASPTLFSIRGLSHGYGPQKVLEDLSFDILVGECLVILGRSGSGKSVLLRQLNGLESPDQGQILFRGEDIADWTEKQLLPVRRRVAMLFQSGALFDSMNVFENVAFPLREHTDLGDEEIRQRVAQKLALVRLSGVEDKPPSALSGGMRKRVALARSLALDPEAVLFDEPTTGLDPTTGATIASLILSTRELGVTCVVVTHDMALARRVASRVAFLEGGRFRFLGSWAEAADCPDRTFQDFLAGREEEDDHGP